MSTIQGLSIEAQEEARRRARDELYRRQQERLELNRALIEAVRAGLAEAGASGREQASLREALEALRAQLADADAEWEAVRAARASGREAAPSTTEGLRRLAAAVRSGAQALESIEAALREAAHRLDYLTRSAEGDEAAARALREKLSRAAQLSAEMTFLLRDARLVTPTVLTLLAMQSNGYTLRETTSKDGLIGYFVSADRSHQVAVRHRPAGAQRSELARALEQETAYQMEVETFQQQGEACLDVLEDFVLGLEETHLADVTWAPPRRYPKRDGASGIPVPVPVSPADVAAIPPRAERERE